MKNSSVTFANHSTEPGRSKSTLGARSILKIIGAYQRLTAGRVSACRFYPSCSNYAREAIETHGACRGAGLALRRLSRCRPLGPHGVDLVPQPKQARSAQR
jgi:putative membrane protein insertion efficiency factor